MKKLLGILSFITILTVPSFSALNTIEELENKNSQWIVTFADNLRVVDGDTIVLNGEKIRFTGIDTPELKQTCLKDDQEVACGMTAKMLLVKKIGNNTPECISEGKDVYKRTLAECFINGESLSSFLVRSGYAFAYRKYSKKFIKDEEFAKAHKLGMWAMTFQYPWDFRKAS